LRTVPATSQYPRPASAVPGRTAGAVFPLVSETPGTPVAGGSVRGPRQRSPGAGATRVSDGFRGTPTTRQRRWGRERSDRIRTRSAAMGEGAQRPKNRRLCRPPKRSEVPVFLMPFLFIRRIWSFSGRSAGFLLVHQRNDVSTLLCPPAIFHCPRVDNGGTLARLFAGFGLFAVHRFLRCMAPGGHSAAKQR
jgi:hypothetical protein